MTIIKETGLRTMASPHPMVDAPLVTPTTNHKNLSPTNMQKEAPSREESTSIKNHAIVDHMTTFQLTHKFMSNNNQIGGVWDTQPTKFNVIDKITYIPRHTQKRRAKPIDQQMLSILKYKGSVRK